MTPAQGNNLGTCPKCNSPINPGLKFCESCGAKVEQPAVCVQCGAPLLPNTKFCETCGKPVVTAAPPVPAASLAPDPAVVSTPPAAEPPEAAPVPAEVKNSALKPEPAVEPKAKASEPKIPEKPKEPIQKTPAKAPASSTRTLVIAGVVGLVIVAALAWFVLLPMLSGTGTAGAGNGGPLSGVIPLTTTAASGIPYQGSAAPSVSPAQNAASASFILQPTQDPPTNLLVTYQADRDPITGLVTVTFTGGAGQHGVSDVSIRLSRSDGQVLTQSFKPQQIGSTTTLKGTLLTDRIEIIANYYNGEKYRIIDKLFEYKKKF
jgi:hypothetical protein